MTKKRILVIEDEKHIAEGLKLNLSLQGYDVFVERDGMKGLMHWKTHKPDLLVLDLMLPTLDGHKILKAIREIDQRAPILVLSAKDQAKDKVSCLLDGVDDYIAKPFDLDEFLLRVRRLIQQSEWYSAIPEEGSPQFDEALKVFHFGQSSVDLEKLVAKTPSAEFTLTVQEAQVLRLFFSNPGRPLSRKELLEYGWGYDAETSTRTIDNFIVRLRRYFEVDPREPAHFISIRSVGYIFKP